MKKQLLLLLISLFTFPIVFSENIIIDGKTYRIDTVANFKAGPGTQYTAVELRGSKRMNVFFLKVDLTNEYVTYKSALGQDSIYSGERPTNVAARKSKPGEVYFAGTNGDFYETSGYIGYPTGISMIESELARIPTQRRMMAFDSNKIPYTGLMTYSGSAKIGNTQFPIHHTNHLRESNQLVLYNQYNGKYTRTNEFGTEVLVELLSGQVWGTNAPVKVRVVKVENNIGSMRIPKGSAVLSGHGTAKTFLDGLTVGDEVEINLNLLLDGTTTAPFVSAVGGDPRMLMLKNGVPNTTNVWAELHPRTGFGYSQDKKTVIHCVVDGRSPISAGATTKELAEIMLSAGAYDAINLDGGGSSSLFINKFGPMNRTSDGSERAVSNGIYVVSTSPSDNSISEILSYETTIKLPRFGLFKPKFLAYNQYGMLLDKDLQNVTLSCPPEMGSINENGEFYASGTVDGVLTATYQGITTTINIDIITDAKFNLRLKRILTDNRREYPIEVLSVVGNNTMTVVPHAFNWEVRNPEICSVTNGILKGISNGSTYVVGSLESFKDSIFVTIEVPESGRIRFDDFDLTNWKFESTYDLGATISNSNLPAGWNSGAVINYTYKTTMAPYLKLSRSLSLYSLPDTMKLGLNLGDISLTKASITIKANNITTYTVLDEMNLPKNVDTEIVIPFDKVFDTNDMGIYPIRFQNINFLLDKQTAGQAYTLAVKEILLLYKGVEVTYLSPNTMTMFQVYPNPAKNGSELYVRLDENMRNKPLKVSIYNLNGQILYTKKHTQVQNTEIAVPIHQKAGIYLLEASNGKQSGTVKIVVK